MISFGFVEFSEWVSNLTFVEVFNLIILLAFGIGYAYQLYYVVIALLKQPEELTAKKNHRYAVLIPARHEQAVIGDLQRSIKNQTYDTSLIDVFVIADNCTDATAEVAQENGAHVIERNQPDLIGKGYGLDFALNYIWDKFGQDKHEAFFVFDADNVLDKRYFEEMNKTFDNGAKASTSYRNSKNFDSNWISSGYALWFLKEAKFLNQARLQLNTGAAVSGTGFFIASDVLIEAGGWKWHLLTEDIQFSADSAVHERRISYNPRAVLYDEQPTTFKASWDQRCRWAKGFYQVFFNYAGKLFKGFFTNEPGYRFACWDMLMTVAPGMLLTVIVLALNISIVILGILGVFSLGTAVMSALSSAAFGLINYLLFMFLFGVLTTFIEWENIHTSTRKKLVTTITFPFFQITYVPIAIVALFKKVTWKPIEHSFNVDVDDYSERGKR